MKTEENTKQGVKKLLITMSEEEYEYLLKLQEKTLSSTYQDVFFFLLRQLFFDPQYRKRFLDHAKNSVPHNHRKHNRIYKITVYLSQKEMETLESMLDVAKLLKYGVQAFLRELICYEGRMYGDR